MVHCKKKLVRFLCSCYDSDATRNVVFRFCSVPRLISIESSRVDHIQVLGQIFDRLEKYQVELNPKKCVFGVTSGKLLGYIVSRKGIEIDLAKVKAIVEMFAPKNLKALRSLQGRLQSMRQFISQLADKGQPFQHLL